MRLPVSRAGLFRLAGRLAAGPNTDAVLRRIVVVKPDHLGDVLLASPALHALRRHFPTACITLAVGPRSAALARRLPDVDEVVVIPFPGLDRRTQPGAVRRWALLLRVAQRWHGQFDAGLLLRDDYYWGAMLLAAARIPLRLGTAFPLCAPFLTRTVPPARQWPAAAQHQHVLGLLTGDRPSPVHWNPDDRLRFAPHDAAADAAQCRRQTGLERAEPYLLLHPGAGAPVKLWTAENWALVLRALQARTGRRTLVVAGVGEQHLIAPIVRLAGGAAIGLPAAPNLDLLSALMRDAGLVLGADSGPLHLAVAIDVPSVRLYGPVDPVIYGPWGDPQRHRWVASRMLCTPCARLDWDALALPWHPCVRRIDPAEVVTAAMMALAAPG